jgi:hypothetical protein
MRGRSGIQRTIVPIASTIAPFATLGCTASHATETISNSTVAGNARRVTSLPLNGAVSTISNAPSNTVAAVMSRRCTSSSRSHRTGGR